MWHEEAKGLLQFLVELPLSKTERGPATRDKSVCEKAHMKWDDSSKTCAKGGY